ncbi:hypothetical protein [Staphylococcus canis]|uniref:Uncharacterized protein n=1 Tax=Staphylococcus canis TaxID=2724942 RepID=A0ABS0T6Z8_9STAP|nr:hypothetical protein [Staphylococcus canis]MBI5974345.1 hypothetical protein [Staphylococcus canis]
MNKRYMKILVLYIISSGIAALSGRTLSQRGLCRWLIETTIGFGVFSYGLKVMKRAKMDR